MRAYIHVFMKISYCRPMDHQNTIYVISSLFNLMIINNYSRNSYHAPLRSVYQTLFHCHQNLEQIGTLIKKVGEENRLIEQHIEKIIQFKTKVLGYNKELIRSLQIYKVISEKAQKDTFERQLSNFKISNLSNIEKNIQKEIKKVNNKILSLKDSQFVSFKQFN